MVRVEYRRASSRWLTDSDPKLKWTSLTLDLFCRSGKQYSSGFGQKWVVFGVFGRFRTEDASQLGDVWLLLTFFSVRNIIFRQLKALLSPKKSGTYSIKNLKYGYMNCQKVAKNLYFRLELAPVRLCIFVQLSDFRFSKKSSETC